MAARYADPCVFDTLSGKHVPHILDKIFLSLDYESFKTCTEVNSVWKRLLTSESFQKKAKSVFRQEIKEDEKKLWQMSQSGNTNEVRRIMSLGMVDINTYEGGLDETTALYEAADNGHKDVIKILLGGGADPDKASGSVGMAPLHMPALKGNTDVVQLLLNSGANPNVVSFGGLTPLFWAAANDHFDVSKLLIENGADPNKVENEGDLPLHGAACNAYYCVVKLLVDKGAEINKAEYMFGKTALHYAAQEAKGGGTNDKCYREVIQFLLDNGGDPRKEDTEGETPLSYALRNGNMGVVKMMKEANVRFSA